jgi:hypothetical protein
MAMRIPLLDRVVLDPKTRRDRRIGFALQEIRVTERRLLLRDIISYEEGG